jgi:catalase
MTSEEADRLMDNIAESVKDVPDEIQLRQIHHFERPDPRYGCGVRARLAKEVSFKHPEIQFENGATKTVTA